MNGFHRHVNSSQSLRALLVDYYNVFYDNQRNSNVIITTPFVDYEGLGENNYEDKLSLFMCNIKMAKIYCICHLN